MNLDDTQARYLAQRVAMIRPDWTEAALVRAVDHLPDSLDFMAVVRVAEGAARDPSAGSPGVIWSWWSRYHATPGAAAQQAQARRLAREGERRTAASPDYLARLRVEAAAGNPLPFGGPHCWRHPDRRVIAPYDECGQCLDERHHVNTLREAGGLPIRPPVQAAARPW